MIASIFEKARKENRTMLMPYFPVGYPTLSRSKKVFLNLAKNGADLLEVGIPFSDPIADGPVIQKASTVALKAGLKVEQVFGALNDIKKKLPPTIIMTYYNLLYKNGLKNFARKAAKAGVKGVIVPDLTVEEAKDWLAASRDQVETIFLVAPTSSDARIKKISKASSSFLYCVSLTGVTGARNKLPKSTYVFLKRVRSLTKKPIAVGFGISKREQVNELRPLSDGIIVGSSLIKAYTKAKTETDSLKNIEKFIKRLGV
ncbi:MAG: tryptophan synthase subunit alpha [Actinobacteria bacterium]|nr:MAG: tryptophan synthase subunit alpha [Actinomycetota bacterium]